MSEKKLGGWSLIAGTVLAAVGYALSPGRGFIDNVPSTELTMLTKAMAANAELAYTMPVVIVVAGLLILNGLVALWRHAGPLTRLGVQGMIFGLLLLVVTRGLDYMITGLGESAAAAAAPEIEADKLRSALEIQRVAWGLHFTYGVAGFLGTGIAAFGLAFDPEPVRLPRRLNIVAGALAVAMTVIFVAAWHSDDLELAVAPAFALASVGGLAYTVLLGWRLAHADDAEAPDR